MLVSALCLLSIVSLFSGCVNVPNELTQFSIFSFNVDPSIINQGESANLSWVVLAAASVSIDNGIGSVALTGHRIIQPTQTTTYILTASNATLVKSATVTISVRVEQPTLPLETPAVACTTDSTLNRITIASADLNVKWRDIVVTMDNSDVAWRVYSGSDMPVDGWKSTAAATADVSAGDYLSLQFNETTNPTNVRVTLRYIPSNSLLGTWTVNV